MDGFYSVKDISGASRRAEVCELCCLQSGPDTQPNSTQHQKAQKNDRSLAAGLWMIYYSWCCRIFGGYIEPQASGLDTVWVTVCTQKLVSLFTASGKTHNQAELHSQHVSEVTPWVEAPDNGSVVQNRDQEIRDIRRWLQQELKVMNITWGRSQK